MLYALGRCPPLPFRGPSFSCWDPSRMILASAIHLDLWAHSRLLVVAVPFLSFALKYDELSLPSLIQRMRFSATQPRVGCLPKPSHKSARSCSTQGLALAATRSPLLAFMREWTRYNCHYNTHPTYQKKLGVPAPTVKWSVTHPN